jgi:hypothetical protein
MSKQSRKAPVKKRNTAIAKRARATSAAKRPAAATSNVAKTGKAAKPAKGHDAMPAPARAAKRPRVRGTFSIPETDYARIGSLKAQAKRGGFKVKKNELIRLGLRSLQSLDETELQARVRALRDADATVLEA